MTDHEFNADPAMARLAPILRRVLGDPALVVRRTDWTDDVDDWNSFTLVETTLAIEAAYGVSLGLDELDDLSSFGDMADRLDARLAAAGRPSR